MTNTLPTRAAFAAAGLSLLLLGCNPTPPTPTAPAPLKPVQQVPDKVLTQVIAPTPPSGNITATPAAPGVAGGYPNPGPTGAIPTPREIAPAAYPKP